MSEAQSGNIYQTNDNVINLGDFLYSVWDQTHNGIKFTSTVEIGTIEDLAAEASLAAIQAGKYTTPTHTAVSVSYTASTSVLAVNANRKYLLLINDSVNAMYVNLGGTAVAHTGILIPAGGSYEMSTGKGNIYTGAITGISMTAAGTLLVTEGV